MVDPFDVLRSEDQAIAPDPEFANRLRARIERALSLPKGVTVSDLEIAVEEETLERAIDPEPIVGTASITPYISVAGALRAIEFYGAAFGARKLAEPIMMPDGRVGHVELEIAGALLMMADEFPEIGFEAPTAEHGSGVTLHLSVDDVDAVVERAVRAGANLDRPAEDFEYGRNAAVTDPFGHRWLIMAAPAARPGASSERGFRQGDIGYVSLQVPDVDRALRFFSSVVGWHYEPPRGHPGRRVEGLSVHHGILGGEEHPTLFCCFAVDDINEAASRVRSAGGTAGEPHAEPYGAISDCVDDQGVAFALFEPPGGTERSETIQQEIAGDLVYVTMEVVDSTKARAFFGAVLGWEFDGGSVEDGWQVRDVNPLVGISGANARATTLPLYRVRDINVAVEAVRAAGGTATEPEQFPYGITSNCVDDQGTRFYMGQL